MFKYIEEMGVIKQKSHAFINIFSNNILYINMSIINYLYLKYIQGISM